MSQPVSALASGVMAAGVPASAKLSINARVRTTADAIGVLSDVMQFSGPYPVGNWVLGATRVKILGVPAVSQSATGLASGPVLPPTVPMTVSLGDARVKGS